MTSLLDGLNVPQQKAVTTTEGPVLILAGPGSGKTRVITHRIAYLVRECGVAPSSVLAVTFTNKAAREMRGRLETLVGPGAAKAMTLSTFHSICARMLRHEADYLSRYGMDPHYSIYDVADQERVVKQALTLVDASDLHFEEKKPPRPGELLDRISWSKSQLWSDDRTREEATTDLERLAARVRPQYDRLLRVQNALDFDDLLSFGQQVLRDHPERLRFYQRRWRYLHVDEFQDCNLPQYRFIQWLARGSEKAAGGPQHICVVGDDDQLIYSWRGASVQNIVRFEEHFPQRELILLEQNYRSTQVILDAAQCVVQKNADRKEKNLWTTSKGGERVWVRTCFDDREEARAVAQEIRRLKERGVLANWKDVAVLYRINALSRTLEEQLRRLLIPYVVIGSKSFYERKEIKDVLAYLRLLYNPKDDQALLRVVNEPSRKIGNVTLNKLQLWASDQSWSLFEAIGQIQLCPTLKAEPRRSLTEFGRLIEDLLQDKTRLSLPELFDAVLEKTGYLAELVERKKDEDIDRAANVAELRRVAEECAAEAEADQALELFLEQAGLLGATESEQTGSHGGLAEENKDAVRLMTLHAAKGLEFPVVMIVGMNEGVIPHARSWATEEGLREERRLAYVGFTRAMKRLYLFAASLRYVSGESRESATSRFLDDLSSHLLQK
jgi:DNA helicase-2/ATP-dependent DNA helicase PcrA